MFLRIFFSLISIFVGLSAFVVFFWMKNYPASVFGLFSGILSLMLFHIHRLKCRSCISEVYSPDALWKMGWFGYGCFAISVSTFVYHIIIFVGAKIPILPVEGSYLITAVWCAISAKNGLLLFYYSRKYSRFVETVPNRQRLLPPRTTDYRPHEIAPGPQTTENQQSENV